MAGFFIRYFRCPVDMLSQILYDKTVDGGKQFIFFTSWLDYHILVFILYFNERANELESPTAFPPYN